MDGELLSETFVELTDTMVAGDEKPRPQPLPGPRRRS